MTSNPRGDVHVCHPPRPSSSLSYPSSSACASCVGSTNSPSDSESSSSFFRVSFSFTLIGSLESTPYLGALGNSWPLGTK